MIEPIDFNKCSGSQTSYQPTVTFPEPYLYREKTERGERIWDFRKLLEDAVSIRRDEYPKVIVLIFLIGNDPSDPLELSGPVAETFWKYVNTCIQLSPYQLVRDNKE